MSKILKELLILLACAGLIWFGIHYFKLVPEKKHLISTELEEELGEKYVDFILKDPSFERFENETIDSVLAIITERLESGLDTTNYNYKYIVIENSMVNAFTLPGGNILITTGLLKYCESSGELASVIAHEMGHVEKRHVISRIVKELGISILTSGDTFVMGEVTKTITSSGFDRGQEKEADQFACELLYKAGLEPRMMASLFRRLKNEEGNELLEKFELVASHPNFTHRIKDILEFEVPEDFVADSLEADINVIKDKLAYLGE